jgi:hypothetical protein
MGEGAPVLCLPSTDEEDLFMGLFTRYPHPVERIAALEKLFAELTRRLDVLAASIERTSATKMNAQLDDVRGAVEAMTASHRRELGKIWGRLGAASNVGRPNGDLSEADPDLASLLDLQKATHPGG